MKKLPAHFKYTSSSNCTLKKMWFLFIKYVSTLLTSLTDHMNSDLPSFNDETISKLRWSWTPWIPTQRSQTGKQSTQAFLSGQSGIMCQDT